MGWICCIPIGGMTGGGGGGGGGGCCCGGAGWGGQGSGGRGGSGRRSLDGGVGLVFRRLGLGGMGREGR